MKSVLMTLVILGSMNASAADGWKNRLNCFGPLATFTSFTAEIKSSINNDGTVREVYFGKDATKEKYLITEKCNIANKTLICEGKKVTIKVDISKRYTHSAFIGVGYTYYETKVSYKGLFNTTEEEIRCRD